jgi:nitric-oxide synthase
MSLETALRIASATNPLRQRLRTLSLAEKLAEAEAFIRQFYVENNLGIEARDARLCEVRTALESFNHYEHTTEELAFGARVAWRNHARCIGRLFWKSLVVVDRREVTDPAEIAACCAEHLLSARGVSAGDSGASPTSGGSGGIRSTITIFAPVRGDRMPAHIESRQLVQYAGYLAEDGSILGDPASIEATRMAIELGWNPPAQRSRFDVLPLQVCDEHGQRHLFEYPDGVVQEALMEHPTQPAFASLGLRWYTVPAVSSMVLSIGGIEYPCAPFNGFYMASEIASRNFADVSRYDQLRAAAEVLAIDTTRPLWKDRVLTELNEVVLYSFKKVGATILDHHTASEQFMEFFQKERSAGREPSAEWSWIVPPQASAACPVYHLAMEDRHMVPNYYGSAATDGAKLGLQGVREASEALDARDALNQFDTTLHEPGAAARASDHHARSSDVTASDVSRCPFARGLGLLAGRFSTKGFLAKKLSKPFHHPTSLNSL